MLVSQHSSKKNRIAYPESVEIGQDCLEVFRLINFKEHIFNQVQSLREPMIDFWLYNKWQVNKFRGYCQNQLTPALVMLDLTTVGQEGSEWKEINIDFTMLNKLGQNKCYNLAQDLPILITKRHVQPMIPVHIFSLVNFLNQE